MRYVYAWCSECKAMRRSRKWVVAWCLNCKYGCTAASSSSNQLPPARPPKTSRPTEWRDISGGTIITCDANNNQYVHFFLNFHQYTHDPIHAPSNWPHSLEAQGIRRLAWPTEVGVPLWSCAEEGMAADEHWKVLAWSRRGASHFHVLHAGIASR